MSDSEQSNVQSLANLHEGDQDPILKKVIRRLIWSDQNFLVYLCRDLRIHFTTTDAYGKLPEAFGKINDKATELEATSGVLLKDKSLLEEFRALLGESLSRVLEEKKPDNAATVLAKAEELLEVWAFESARKSYLLSCLCVTLISLLVIVILWMSRVFARGALGPNAFDVIVGCLLGAPGAMISVYTRFKDLPIDKKSSKSTQYIDGATRIFAAMLGALFAAVCIKANVAIGFANTVPNTVPLLFVICLAAGASERLVPSLISQVESTPPKKGGLPLQGQGKP